MGELPEPLLCGTFEVPEDHGAPEGRRISLKVVVVPAQSERPPDDPVWIFEGGPGGAVTARAAGSIYAGAVRARDIVLADQRGTGGSSPIDCALATATEPGVLREMYPREALERCVEDLARRADLLRYTSVDHARDVEHLRRALGYGQLDLRGGSYGSRAMMVYAQLYPENVRTMFGIGVDAPLSSNLAERGLSAQQALEGLSRLCAEDPVCRSLAPDLADSSANLLAHLDDAPRRVRLDHPVATERLSSTGRAFELDVQREWLSEQLRLVLYFAFTTRALPWAVAQAETGDWQPLVGLALAIEKMFQSTLSTGVALTVQCSENMAFDLDQALEHGSRTVFGNYRLEQQVRGCSAWPHLPIPPLGRSDPQVLDVPTLFLSGRFDAVTPPRYAEQARELFPVSRHVVLEEGQHGPFDLEGAWGCVHAMWAQLLETADIAAIDDSCAATMSRPAWVSDSASFWAVIDEELLPD